MNSLLWRAMGFSLLCFIVAFVAIYIVLIVLRPSDDRRLSGHWIPIADAPTGAPCWGWVLDTADDDWSIQFTTCACTSSPHRSVL